jgi:hypothetical protein
MVFLIIEHGVKLVLRKTKKSSPQNQDGNLLAIRKKPHVIDVASEQSIQHSY